MFYIIYYILYIIYNILYIIQGATRVKPPPCKPWDRKPELDFVSVGLETRNSSWASILTWSLKLLGEQTVRSRCNSAVLDINLIYLNYIIILLVVYFCVSIFNLWNNILKQVGEQAVNRTWCLLSSIL